MKKLSVYFMMLAMMMAVTFVACNKNEDEISDPKITMPNAITVDLNDLEGFQPIDVAVNADEDLTSVKVSVQAAGNDIYVVENVSFEGKTTTGWAKTYTLDDFPPIELIEPLKDSDLTFCIEALTKSTNAFKSASITVIPFDDEPGETDLTDAVAFTLGRPEHSGFPATDMGITWASNVDGNTAKFTTAKNALIILPNEATYNAITTQEVLKAAFEAVPEASRLSEFTAKSDANFTAQYLIVQDGATLRLIKMTGLEFKPNENKGYFTEKH